MVLKTRSCSRLTMLRSSSPSDAIATTLADGGGAVALLTNRGGSHTGKQPWKLRKRTMDGRGDGREVGDVAAVQARAVGEIWDARLVE